MPSCMFIRDDYLYNAGFEVFFDLTWYHDYYYAFLILERIFGDYQIDKHGSAHVNSAKKQYRLSELWLSHKMSPKPNLSIHLIETVVFSVTIFTVMKSISDT